MRNLTKRGDLVTFAHFWEQKMYRIKEKKDGLVHVVVEEGNQKPESEAFIEISFYRVNNFQHLLREKATENNSSSNSKNNSNIAIRK